MADQQPDDPYADGVANRMSRISAHHALQARDIGTVSITSAPAAPPGAEQGRPPVRLPPLAGESFVGRQPELALLDAAFTPATGTRTGPTAAVVHQQRRGRVGAVHGLGGIGKSTLAAHWAATRRREDQAVWWITADSVEAVREGLAGLGTALLGTDSAGHPMEVLAEHAIGWLNGHDGWLLVLDNVHRPADVEPLLARLHAATGGRVLITTRLGTGWGRITRRVIALDVLPLEQAVRLLTRTVTAERPDADLDGAAELCRELGRLPLAIEQAAGYLAENVCSPRVYLQRLAARPADLYARTAPGNDEADRTVARIWNTTLDHLATGTPLAGTVLRVLAWFAPENIPRVLLNGLEAADERVRAAGGTPAVQEAVGRLAAYNMITLSEAGRLVSVHRLVQATARTPAPAGVPDPHRRPADIDAARRQATALLNSACPADVHDPAGWPVWRLLLPHIDALVEHASPDTDGSDTALLCNETGRFLEAQGATTSSVAYEERAVTAYERTLGPDHPDTLTARSNLAHAHWEAGERRRTVAMFKQVLADRERVLGDDHPRTLGARNDVAYMYWATGDVQRSIELHEQVLADQVRLLGDDHPDILTSLSNLGNVYRIAGDAQRSIELHKQVLAAREQTLGAGHPTTLTSLKNLANAYRAAGDVQRSIALLEQVLADQEQVLGEVHPTVLAIRNDLANAYLAAGDAERAIALQEQVLADQERLLGEVHPTTLISRNDLANAYWGAGDVQRSIALSERTLTECRRVLGDDHPTTCVVRRNLETALRMRDREDPPVS
ncbi:FxSxx-COOH system tetratricopeptide repeat protein [Spirillospora sp. CA-253888]